MSLSFAIILTMKGDGCFALIVLCIVTVNVLWLFRTGLGWSTACDWVFPDHTHLLLASIVFLVLMNVLVIGNILQLRPRLF